MIRLVLVDVDGCLTDGEGQPLDLAAIAEVARINERSRTDAATPAVTLCTGRPAPYVEVLQQAIAGYMPAIFENGCGLIAPEPYGFRTHPALDGQLAADFQAARALLRARLVDTGRAFFQPGKEHSATLYPRGMPVPELYLAVRELVGERLTVDEGRLCVNIMPAGIDKAAGASWLSEQTGIPLQDMAGIGDSDGDLCFLRVVSLAAAPANACAAVREMAAIVSELPSARGVVQLLGAVEARNRGLVAERSCS